MAHQAVEVARAPGRTLEQAVLEAGAVRFRPILLTAGTVVGLRAFSLAADQVV